MKIRLDLSAYLAPTLRSRQHVMGFGSSPSSRQHMMDFGSFPGAPAQPPTPQQQQPPKTMDSIAARLKAKPRASKKPNPLYTSPAVRRNSVAKAHTIADLSSAFNWTEIFLVERALPQDPEVQTFMRYYRDRDRPDRGTAEFVRKRNEFLRKKLPLLYDEGLIRKIRARGASKL